MGSGHRRLLRNLWASFAVAATIGAIGIGLPAINDSLASARPLPAGQTYEVAAGVALIPPLGAGLDVTKTEPGPHQGAALFVVGPVQYAVVVSPFDGTLDAAVARLRGKITSSHGYQIAGGEVPVVTQHGVTGRQGMYASSSRAGRYAVFVADGLAVEVTIAGNDIDLQHALAGIEASVRTISFGAKT
jgi:hypothetical protein